MIKLAKDKTSKFRLMGFGHRIYKSYDPRATIMKDLFLKVSEKAENKEVKEFMNPFAVSNISISKKFRHGSQYFRSYTKFCYVSSC